MKCIKQCLSDIPAVEGIHALKKGRMHYGLHYQHEAIHPGAGTRAGQMPGYSQQLQAPEFFPGWMDAKHSV